MRAIIKYNKDDYINIEGDFIEHDCGWVKVYLNGNLVAMFGEEIVNCAYLSRKGE